MSIRARSSSALTRTVAFSLALAALAAAPAWGDEGPPLPAAAKPFAGVDRNGNGAITRAEAAAAGLRRLDRRWSHADGDGDTTLDRAEYRAWFAQQGPITIGQGQLATPETVRWDEQADVYLISNVNGELGVSDDNGFISRIAPDGTMVDRKWIDAERPQVVLHAPKGMILAGNRLIVADLGAVRYFARSSGAPIRAVSLPRAYMPNDLALDPDGRTVYVTDTGGSTAQHAGAVYRLDPSRGPVRIAEGRQLDRPNGLVQYEDGFLVAPFGAHAKEIYRLGTDGQRRPFAAAPAAQLDGLLRLPDGSLVVTSWQGQAVYRRQGGRMRTIATDLPGPAQVGYDRKRRRLLVPVSREDRVLSFPVGPGR